MDKKDKIEKNSRCVPHSVPVNTFSPVCVPPREGCFCTSQIYRSFVQNCRRIIHISFIRNSLEETENSVFANKGANLPEIKSYKIFASWSVNFPRLPKSVWRLSRNSNCLDIILSANYVL